MTSGGGRDTVFQETQPGAGFKTGDFAKEKFGGGGGGEPTLENDSKDSTGCMVL